MWVIEVLELGLTRDINDLTMLHNAERLTVNEAVQMALFLFSRT